MTQEQVNTGYGIYGPRTKAAFANAQQKLNPTLTKLSKNEASQMYQNGPGIGSSA